MEAITFDDLDRLGEMLFEGVFDLMLAWFIWENCLSHHHVEIVDEVFEGIAAVTD